MAQEDCIIKIKNKMAKTEEQINSIKDKLDNIPTRKEMQLDNRELIEEILQKTDKKYADKKTEKIVNALVVGIFLLSIAITLTVVFGQNLPIDIGL